MEYDGTKLEKQLDYIPKYSGKIHSGRKYVSSWLYYWSLDDNEEEEYDMTDVNAVPSLQKCGEGDIMLKDKLYQTMPGKLSAALEKPPSPDFSFTFFEYTEDFDFDCEKSLAQPESFTRSKTIITKRSNIPDSIPKGKRSSVHSETNSEAKNLSAAVEKLPSPDFSFTFFEYTEDLALAQSIGLSVPSITCPSRSCSGSTDFAGVNGENLQVRTQPFVPSMSNNIEKFDGTEAIADDRPSLIEYQKKSENSSAAIEESPPKQFNLTFYDSTADLGVDGVESHVEQKCFKQSSVDSTQTCDRINCSPEGKHSFVQNESVSERENRNASIEESTLVLNNRASHEPIRRAEEYCERPTEPVFFDSNSMGNARDSVQSNNSILSQTSFLSSTVEFSALNPFSDSNDATFTDLFRNENSIERDGGRHVGTEYSDDSKNIFALPYGDKVKVHLPILQFGCPLPKLPSADNFPEMSNSQARKTPNRKEQFFSDRKTNCSPCVESRGECKRMSVRHEVRNVTNPTELSFRTPVPKTLLTPNKTFTNVESAKSKSFAVRGTHVCSRYAAHQSSFASRFFEGGSSHASPTRRLPQTNMGLNTPIHHRRKSKKGRIGELQTSVKMVTLEEQKLNIESSALKMLADYESSHDDQTSGDEFGDVCSPPVTSFPTEPPCSITATAVLSPNYECQSAMNSSLAASDPRPLIPITRAAHEHLCSGGTPYSKKATYVPEKRELYKTLCDEVEGTIIRETSILSTPDRKLQADISGIIYRGVARSVLRRNIRFTPKHRSERTKLAEIQVTDYDNNVPRVDAVNDEIAPTRSTTSSHSEPNFHIIAGLGSGPKPILRIVTPKIIQPSTDPAKGFRRSSRVRVRPLRHYLGEEIIYELDEHGNRTIAAVKTVGIADPYLVGNDASDYSIALEQRMKRYKKETTTHKETKKKSKNQGPR